MNYTKTIRTFCEQRKNSIFDSLYVYNTYFEMVPKKTYEKIIKRLCDEGLLIYIDRGTYYIGAKEFDVNEAIINYYVNDYSGMFIGHKMLEELDIAYERSDEVEMITNNIALASKRVLNYRLYFVDVILNKNVVRLIQLLELIQNVKLSTYNDIDFLKYDVVKKRLARFYTDINFRYVISKIEYSYSTIANLDRILKEAGINNNRCIEIYRESYGE